MPDKLEDPREEIARLEKEKKESEQTKKHLSDLSEVDTIVRKLRLAKQAFPNYVSYASSLLQQNSELLSRMADACDFLKTTEVGKVFLDHDLAGIAGNIEGWLVALSMNPKLTDASGADSLLNDWDRYKIAAEDVMLRILESEKVPEEFQTGVNLDTLERAVDYFQKSELLKLPSHQKSEKSNEYGAYEGIENRNLILPTAEEWEQLESDLIGYEVAGNTGVLGNFILNELRNSLKHKIDAKNVTLKFKVVAGALLVTLTDDGAGMRPDQLSERSKAFIFNKGTSGTGSTGVGVSNFPLRLISMNGGIRVHSINKTSKGKITYEESPEGMDFGAAPKINKSHGTVFEIRLPLTKKAA